MTTHLLQGGSPWPLVCIWRCLQVTCVFGLSHFLKKKKNHTHTNTHSRSRVWTFSTPQHWWSDPTVFCFFYVNTLFFLQMYYFTLSKYWVSWDCFELLCFVFIKKMFHLLIYIIVMVNFYQCDTRLIKKNIYIYIFKCKMSMIRLWITHQCR